VCINQANSIIVRDCVIHHNDMGIMSNGDGTPDTATDQRIEGCLIHSNGDPADPGFNHNLYLGGTSVTLIGCEVHSSLTGHNVKSRAHRTTVLASFIHDAANREFDLDADPELPSAAPVDEDWHLAGKVREILDPGCGLPAELRVMIRRPMLEFGPPHGRGEPAQ
jgi:hypothetical protein